MAGKRQDLTGQRFGKLVVIGLDPNYVPKSGRHAKWLCKCDCGNEKVVQSNHLKDGSQSACSPMCKHIIEKGTIFGQLTVLEPTENRSKGGGHVIYKCQCSCGNIIQVPSSELRTGRKFCCELCKASSGEIKIAQILHDNNIEYIKQYCFPDLINNQTGRNFRFDFYIPNKNYLIEYDGEPHFQAIPGSIYKGEQGLKQRQQRDAIKNQYCKNHNIPLIRIPYTAYDNLSIVDLQLQSSQFLI